MSTLTTERLCSNAAHTYTHAHTGRHIHKHTHTSTTHGRSSTGNPYKSINYICMRLCWMLICNSATSRQVQHKCFLHMSCHNTKQKHSVEPGNDQLCCTDTHTCGRLQYWMTSATASVAAEQPQPSRATSTWSVLSTSLINASSAFLPLHCKNSLV